MQGFMCMVYYSHQPFRSPYGAAVWLATIV